MTKLTKQQLALRTKWTTALRSGEYRQAKRVLVSESGAMCCLGVLCEVNGVARGIDVEGRPAFGHGQEASTFLPPHAVVVAAGLQGDGDWVGDEDGMAPYVLNDRLGYSFDEIADAIDLDTLMRQDGCL